MGRADGIHFGTGTEPGDGILDLLGEGAPTLLNEPEGQWHWTDMATRRPGALTVYRAAPAVLPAQVNWDAHAYSREIFKSLDALHDRTGSYPSDVLLMNELNLDYERGDSRNDGGAFDTNPGNWPTLYSKLSLFLISLLVECKDRASRRDGFHPRWWFQGWAPGHGEMNDDIAPIWVGAARSYDGVVLHAYHDRETITDTVLWYARTFPNTPLLLGEWNMSGLAGDWRSADKHERREILAVRVEEEERVRARLKSLADQIPLFHACYFIHKWESDDSREHDIVGVDARKALWDGRTEIEADGYVIPGDIVTTPPPPVDPPAQPPEVPPVVVPAVPATQSGADPEEFWTYQQIADATDSLVENVQEHWRATVDQLVLCRINTKNVQRGMIATFAVETGPRRERRMTPVREAYWLDDDNGFEWAEEYRRTHEPSSRYFPFYGRGKVQRTWEDAYAAVGRQIAELWEADPSDPTFDLVAHPDNLLDRDMSAASDAIFFRDKRALPSASYPDGYSLIEACEDRDAFWIRKLVQGGSAGLDHLQTVLAALDAYDVAEPPQEPPTAPDPAPQPSYNPDYPVIAQDRTFDCSETALLWELHAHGRDTADKWLEGRMMADGIMTEEWGLMDATGHGLAAFGNHYYGGFTTPGYSFGEPAEDLGYRFEAFGTDSSRPSFDDLASVADGAIGVMAGGRSWVHWIAIRRYNRQADVFEIANSADGYKGVGQILTRAQFAALGWFSYVTVRVIDMAAQEPAPEPVVTPAPSQEVIMQAKLHELMAAYAESQRQLEEARRALGVATVDVADAFAKAPPKFHASADVIDAKLAAVLKATSAKAVRPLVEAIKAEAQNVRVVTDGDVVPALEALRGLHGQG